MDLIVFQSKYEGHRLKKKKKKKNYFLWNDNDKAKNQLVYHLINIFYLFTFKT